MCVVHSAGRHTSDAHMAAIDERRGRRCLALDDERREVALQHGVSRIDEARSQHDGGGLVRHRYGEGA